MFLAAIQFSPPGAIPKFLQIIYFIMESLILPNAASIYCILEGGSFESVFTKSINERLNEYVKAKPKILTTLELVGRSVTRQLHITNQNMEFRFDYCIDVSDLYKYKPINYLLMEYYIVIVDFEVEFFRRGNETVLRKLCGWPKEITSKNQWCWRKRPCRQDNLQNWWKAKIYKVWYNFHNPSVMFKFLISRYFIAMLIILIMNSLLSPPSYRLLRVLFISFVHDAVISSLLFTSWWPWAIQQLKQNPCKFTPGKKPAYLPAIEGALLFRAFLFCRKTVGCHWASQPLSRLSSLGYIAWSPFCVLSIRWYFVSSFGCCKLLISLVSSESLQWRRMTSIRKKNKEIDWLFVSSLVYSCLSGARARVEIVCLIFRPKIFCKNWFRLFVNKPSEISLMYLF